MMFRTATFVQRFLQLHLQSVYDIRESSQGGGQVTASISGSGAPRRMGVLRVHSLCCSA